MIDCDLKESTTLALNFAKPSLQEGKFIIFDDLNFYKGNSNKVNMVLLKNLEIKTQILNLEEYLIMVIVVEPLS